MLLMFQRQLRCVGKQATISVSLETSFCMELKPLTSLHVLVSTRNKGYPRHRMQINGIW